MPDFLALCPIFVDKCTKWKKKVIIGHFTGMNGKGGVKNNFHTPRQRSADKKMLHMWIPHMQHFLFPFIQHILDFLHEAVHVGELTVHGGEPHVGDLVNLFQIGP